MGQRTRTGLVAATFGLWSSAIRRRLIDAVACGASQHRGRRKACGGVDAAEPRPLRPRTGGSERLDQLLKAEAANCVAEDAACRKIASLEELQRVVAQMQLDGGNAGGDRRMAAEVRRLAKDNPEARERLALLGAITPLVGMLDSEETDHQITALYALLNLGIGNEL